MKHAYAHSNSNALKAESTTKNSILLFQNRRSSPFKWHIPNLISRKDPRNWNTNICKHVYDLVNSCLLTPSWILTYLFASSLWWYVIRMCVIVYHKTFKCWHLPVNLYGIVVSTEHHIAKPNRWCCARIQCQSIEKKNKKIHQT